MGEPSWVVAVGDCALDGWVDAALGVELAIRGCPPTPAQMLEGLRALVEANVTQSPTRSS